MKNYFLCVILVIFSIFNVFGQQLNQTVRGIVVDADSQIPLIGVELILLGFEPIQGITTDENGHFRLETVPIGRINIQLSYLGYESIIAPNIIVNSGKETIINFKMKESTLSLEAVTVMANTKKGEALNEMALVSARSISAEETNRYAGGFNDPSRIMSNFAGVTSTQDGGNDIIVRGNSPKYIQWRLEGMEITNPNHFADQSSVGGATRTLNNNLLATSDFYTGAFAPEYGDVLAGVYDVKLRAGNNEKFESVFGFGLLGTDLTFEGPISRSKGSSFLVNYRYSTASLVNDLGLLGDIGGIPKFQDAAFKVLLPTKGSGVFSLFGLAGKSSFNWENVSPATWETPGENVLDTLLSNDYLKESYLANIGLNHSINLTDKSYLKSSLLFSAEGIEDEIFDIRNDDSQEARLNFDNDFTKNTYRASVSYHNKISAKNKFQIGIKYAIFDFSIQQSQLNSSNTNRVSLVDLNERVHTVRNFISWKHRFNDELSLVAGVHNMNTLLNNKSTIEPRFALDWKLNQASNLSFGYGKHSMMESIHNYFTRVEEADGSMSEPNKDLGLLKADHFVIAYGQRIGKNVKAKLEFYYQGLYDLPVENLDSSYYSTINEGLDFRYVDLVNEGKGKNYGLELTVEKFFVNSYYYLFNASIYNSKYTSLEGVERNSQYNGNYLVNMLFGKEFIKLGKKSNQTLNLNAKIFFGGGRKIIPLLRNEEGELTVDRMNNRYYDYEKAYENKIEDIYNVILSASYKWNKKRSTHELFLNLDNLTNTRGKIAEFYDESEEGSIGYVSQFGFFPNLMYRVYF